MMVDVFRRHPGGDVMYLQGSKWPSLNVVERLEERVKVPVVQAVAARCWELRSAAGCGSRTGHGSAAAEMPASGLQRKLCGSMSTSSLMLPLRFGAAASHSRR